MNWDEDEYENEGSMPVLTDELTNVQAKFDVVLLPTVSCYHHFCYGRRRKGQ